MTEPQRNWPPDIPVWPDKTVVPPKPPTKAHPVMLAGCVLLLISPLAGVIALVLTDGWAIPVWLGGWILAIVLMGIVAVATHGQVHPGLTCTVYPNELR